LRVPPLFKGTPRAVPDNQASLNMAHFEALYGRKCRTPLYWSETRERQLFGANIIREAEK
jgi:hypothetical protein